MTMESLPQILFGVDGKKDLSDIEYLSIKEFDGKLVKNKGTLSVTGDLATLTASGGKDMYLAKAKVNVRVTTNNIAGGNLIIVLRVNGTIEETYAWRSGSSAGGSGTNNGNNYSFNLSGVKVAATQVIKLEVTTISVGFEANGEITGFEETTGQSPAV